MEQESFKKGFSAVALSAFLWSLGGVLVKLVDWNPLAIASMRSFFAALTMYIMGKPKLAFSWPRLGAALSYAGCMILFVVANKLTTAANTIMLQYTSPIYVAIFGWILLKEKIHWDNLLALIFVFTGMILFFRDDLASGSILGNYLAMISGLCFGLFTVFMRMQKKASTMESMFLAHLLTFAVGIPFVFTSTLSPDPVGWGAILALGVFQTGLSSMLFSVGIKHIPAIIAILAVVIEPLLNPVWVFLITGEKPGPWALIGGILIIISVTGSSLVSGHRAAVIKKV